MNDFNLISENGNFNVGKYKFPLKNIDFLKAEKPYGFFSYKFYKNLRLKEWQAFQAGNEKYFILAAIYNAKTLALVRFILFDKKSDKKIFYEKKLFPSKLKLPSSILDTNNVAEYNSENFSISSLYDSENKIITLSVEIKNFRKLPDLSFKITAEYNPEKHESVSACIPFNEKRAMYSHKALCKASGEMILNNIKHIFNKDDSFFIFDDHKGFYPNPMIYDWITAAKTSEGNTLGFNLTDNQSANPNIYNENCVWENGKTYFVNKVKFYRPDGVKGIWYVKDEEGNVNLQFRPIDHNPLYLNLIFVKAAYEGPFGIVCGTIKTAEKIFEINEFFGMGEKKYVKG